MRSRHAVARVMGVLVLVGCQAPAPEFTSQDEATLRGFFDATPGYVRAGDWATWANQYAEESLLQPPNAPSVSGRANILAWGQAFPPVEDITFSNVRVWGEGNVGYGTSAYALKLKDLSADTGKQLAVFRRLPGGQWAIVAVSFSSDLPAPGPAPTQPGAKK